MINNDFPKYILKHKNTGEVFYVTGIKKIKDDIKYQLCSSTEFKDSRRLVDKIYIESQKFYDIIGNYD